MFCAQCGTFVPEASRFCAACGARMTDPSAATIVPSEPAEEPLLVSVRRALAADYDVQREVGRGGMAVVFKARDKELERLVALKVLPPELAPIATVADRFKREARLAASLDHPNIIPVYRVGQSNGVLYMAMKYIDGRSVDALVAEHGALSLPVVLTVLRAAARAIAYAHDHGIVHRDIKGANILIDRDGRVVVSDFGIARAMESASLTATGVMIGTPHFMSPEQCAGKAVGPQSDQYSLGILAYQLLTGAVPFDGDSLPEILQHHWFTPPPDASLMRPDSPAALTATVLRLLAKDPTQRFASTNDLVAALERVPFTAAERAEGEAELKKLVRARPSTATTQPGVADGGGSDSAATGAEVGAKSGIPGLVIGGSTWDVEAATAEQESGSDTSMGGVAPVPALAQGHGSSSGLPSPRQRSASSPPTRQLGVGGGDGFPESGPHASTADSPGAAPPVGAVPLAAVAATSAPAAGYAESRTSEAQPGRGGAGAPRMESGDGGGASSGRQPSIGAAANKGASSGQRAAANGGDRRRAGVQSPSRQAATGSRPAVSMGRKWRLVAIAAVAIAGFVGAGFVVAARRGMAGAVRGGATAAAPRLDGLQMRRIGHRAYLAGDYELARRFFVRAITLDPNDRDAQADLGCALLKTGHADSAQAHFQLAHREPKGC